MALSEKSIQELKEIVKKDYDKELSDGEATDMARRLVGIAEICYSYTLEELCRKKRLEGSPKGFHIEGIGYSCAICGDSISNNETWYDKYGIKCLLCQSAINKKIIPATAAKNRDSWYSKYDLESRFNINYHALKKFIKHDILKPRIILNEVGSPHAQIFLIKDNEDTLPPKKLTESHTVKETKDGKDWYCIHPWYRFIDPYEHLKGYKIMDHLKVTDEQK